MNKIIVLLILVIIVIINDCAYGQSQLTNYKMQGTNPKIIEWNKTYDDNVEIFPFGKNINRIYGVAVSATIQVGNQSDYLVRLILVDEDFNEHVIYECYNLLDNDDYVSVDELSEETCILNGLRPYSVKIEVRNAILELNSFSYATGVKAGWDVGKIWKEKKKARDEDKINKINSNRQNWVAGETSVSAMSYSDRKKLYGESNFPPGFEFYCGGVISAGLNDSENSTLKSATAESPYINEWDWRNRHGKNWISPVTNQGSCGSCWAFAATGATEAMVNLYYNQQLNLNLSEQDVLSCSGGGNCAGGYPSVALNYIKNYGIVDENTFPYNGIYQPCENKGSNPTDLIKISGKIDFGLSTYPYDEDVLKKMLIQFGPLSSGIIDWSHAIVLVGYKVVKEGDTFFYRDLNLSRFWKTIEAGDPLIGKTVWIFKNSWGPGFGDEGYIYVETRITNIGWTHAIKTPIASLVQNYQVKFEDADGDGYYWWGLGSKPANCPGPDLADGDDSDPTLGPLDEYGYCMPLGPVSSPVADFTATQVEIDKGETITFSDVSTNNPTTRIWTFEGGTPATSTEANPVVKYDNPGDFRVTLTVFNAGGSDTKEVDNFITVNDVQVISLNPPVAGFSADKTELTEGGTVSFSDASTNNPTTWLWTFEGGSPATSTLQNPVVTYSTEGIYLVSLKATNDDGNDTRIIDNYITVTKPIVEPVADFSASKTIITQGETVTFTDLSVNEPTSWNWSIEGSIPAATTSQNPVVTFDTHGTYTVTLTVSNAAGSDTKTKIDYIEVDPFIPEYCESYGNASNEWISMVQLAGSGKNSGSTGYSDFTSTRFNLVSGDSYSIYMVPAFAGKSSFEYWSVWIDFNGDFDFEDAGELVFSPSRTKTSITGVINIPADIANIETRMRISMGALPPSSCGNIGDGEVEDYTVVISAPVEMPPMADFISDKSAIQSGETVQFSDQSENEPTQWLWTFPGGNPASSTLQNPSVSYAASGEYDVTLEVSKPGFSSSSKTKLKYIVASDNIVYDYCVPVSVNSLSDYIKNVAIGSSFNYSTGGDGFSLTENYDAFRPGDTYTVSLEPSNSSVRNFWKILIDFNDDNDFEDSDETILTLNNKKGSTGATITIPSYAVGMLRMRVMMKADKSPSPCDDNFDGEVEDYMISIAPSTPQASLTSAGTEPTENINVYPNPTSNILNLQVANVNPGETFTLLNSNGEIVLSDVITHSQIQINLSNIASGIYFMTINKKDKIYYKKVVKR